MRGTTAAKRNKSYTKLSDSLYSKPCLADCCRKRNFDSTIILKMFLVAHAMHKQNNPLQTTETMRTQILHLYTHLTGERGKKCVEKLWCDETHILINRT